MSLASGASNPGDSKGSVSAGTLTEPDDKLTFVEGVELEDDVIVTGGGACSPTTPPVGAGPVVPSPSRSSGWRSVKAYCPLDGGVSAQSLARCWIRASSSRASRIGLRSKNSTVPGTPTRRNTATATASTGQANRRSTTHLPVLRLYRARDATCKSYVITLQSKNLATRLCIVPISRQTRTPLLGGTERGGREGMSSPG